MKLRIEIELDNAAFEDEGEYAIHDTNGNWCGYGRIVRGTINRER